MSENKSEKLIKNIAKTLNKKAKQIENDNCGVLLLSVKNDLENNTFDFANCLIFNTDAVVAMFDTFLNELHKNNYDYWRIVLATIFQHLEDISESEINKLSEN